MQVSHLILFLIGTYLIAGIPFGLIYVKIFNKKDVRTVGSGNIGATNVLRAAGIGVALLTAISDISKSLLPVILAKKTFTNPLFPYLVWSMAVVGHCISPYLKLKGGKGVATFFGGLLALQPIIAIITFALWLTIVLVSGYVSLGSIVASTIPFIVSLIMRTKFETALIYVILSIIIIYKHKDNIKRLASGTENKLKLKR